MNVEPTLASELRSKDVRIEVPDEDTLVLRRVPINHRYFNKSSTNVLLKRARRGPVFLAWVDENLAYRGDDRSLLRVFTAGECRSGWRVLTISSGGFRDSSLALEASLAALGFRGEEPRVASPGHDIQREKTGGVRRFATNLTEQVRTMTAETTVGRSDEIERLAACLLCWKEARFGLVVGESGVGKTNLLHGLARALSERHAEVSVLRVDAAEITAGAFLETDRETIMLDLLDEVLSDRDAILAVERIDHALTRGGVVEELVSQALDRGLRMVGTALPGTLRRLRRPPLWRRTRVVPLSEPSAKDTAAILAALRTGIAQHHEIQIDEGLLPVAVKLAQGLPGRFPAKAIALLDQAASTASLLRAPLVSPDDLFSAARQSRVEGDCERNADGSVGSDT